MLLHNKGNHKQNKKTTYGLAENICKPCDQQGLNFQNILTSHTAQYQKNKQPNQKMGRRPVMCFCSREQTGTKLVSERAGKRLQ